MKIVVTGAVGRVGRYVVDELVPRHEVVAVDARAPARDDVPFVRADILSLDECRRAVEGADAVIHLAAIPNPLTDPAERVMHVNTMGTWTVLQACAEAGVRRFVQASTDSALGFVFRRQEFRPAYLPIDEAHPLLAQDPYGLSKLLGEQICWSFARGWDIETVCVRICRVIFPDDEATNRRLADDPSLMAKGLWVYVDARDAARAFRLAAETPGLNREAVFAGAPDAYSRVPTADLIARFYPDLAPMADRLPANASFITSAKAKAVLGWEPRFTWRDVVR
ncbi:MAG: NAD(P)-dependent oxidoreductase [Chloroflexota bacterium]|nr:MAG: NAD(P)-dependent oxidoreductase [Chloroflexota bacterium]